MICRSTSIYHKMDSRPRLRQGCKVCRMGVSLRMISLRHSTRRSRMKHKLDIEGPMRWIFPILQTPPRRTWTNNRPCFLRSISPSPRKTPSKPSSRMKCSPQPTCRRAPISLPWDTRMDLLRWLGQSQGFRPLRNWNLMTVTSIATPTRSSWVVMYGQHALRTSESISIGRPCGALGPRVRAVAMLLIHLIG